MALRRFIIILMLAFIACGRPGPPPASPAPTPTPTPKTAAAKETIYDLTYIPGCPSYPEGLTGQGGYGSPDRIWMICDYPAEKVIFLVSYSMRDGTVTVVMWRYAYAVPKDTLQPTPTPDVRGYFKGTQP
jgi:hypothetical protein